MSSIKILTTLNLTKTEVFFHNARKAAEADLAGHWDLTPNSYEDFQDDMKEAMEEGDFQRVAILASYLAQAN